MGTAGDQNLIFLIYSEMEKGDHKGHMETPLLGEGDSQDRFLRNRYWLSIRF